MTELNRDEMELAHVAARNVGAWWRESELGSVVIDGPDAASFLHTMLTADIKRLGIGQSTMACQCSPKGETKAVLLVVRTGETRYLLVMDAGRVGAFVEDLERLHFSEQFSISATSDRLAQIRLMGPKVMVAAEVAGGAGIKGALEGVQPGASVAVRMAGADVRAIRLAPGFGEGWLLVAGSSEATSLEQALDGALQKIGGVKADAVLAERLRIEAGVPRFGVDLPKGALASELGIDHPSLSYDKGCFVGQEIIARIRTKGHAPMRVMGVLFEGVKEPVAAGTPLDGGAEGEAGTVTSSAFSPALGHAVAIARIKKAWQVAGTKVAAKGATGEIVVLPFVLPSAAAAGAMYDEALRRFAENDEAGALELLNRELSERPGNADAWEALGVIHDRAGRHRDAIVAMKKIIELDPKHLMANVNLSMYHMKVGDKATAEEYQARATSISIERRMAEARAKGGGGALDADLERIQKTEARLSKFRQIIDMDPGDVLGHFGAGKACLDLKRFGEAAQHFEKTIEIQKDYSVAWANLGQAYAALGEREKARETFERGIEVARGKGDMMPMRDMQTRLEKLGAGAESTA